MQIIELLPDNEPAIVQAAKLLVTGFKEHYPAAWPTMESAMEMMRDEVFGVDRFCRIAIADDGSVLGWIGGISQYDGHVWELHPLVVHPDYQRQGIGQALVADFEEQVRTRGGLTIWLGTDDEDNMTSLSGIDLFPDPLAHITGIRNLKGHPYEFYQKQGFVIAGVLPDANGSGKPDIFMAKSVRD